MFGGESFCVIYPTYISQVSKARATHVKSGLQFLFYLVDSFDVSLGDIAIGF